jgi:tRNA threonylcarbamoyl adenosine modification protein YeaZ/ribosomal-protein-alanine acetyltransferase
MFGLTIIRKAMRVLALDTTTRGGSVALVEDDRIVDERRGQAARTHGERLPGELLALLGDHSIRVSDVDLFAVAAGPGSFTGLRIGIATIQGLALVHRRRVATVSALEALAQLAGRDQDGGRLVGVWIDAGRGDVFSALYRVTSARRFDGDRLSEVEAPAVGNPSATLTRWARMIGESEISVTGDGAVRYADVIARHCSTARILEPPVLAGAIGLMATRLARAGATQDPAGLRPLYVRRPDAEQDRDLAGFSIEPLSSPADLDAVLAIEAESFMSPWTREMYLAELDNAGVSFCYLARDTSRRVLGFCSFWRLLDELHINNLAVAPAHRRRGVATALLRFVLKEGRRLGARRATLEVRRSNDPARRLYDRLGFSTAGVRHAYYSNPVEDALVLLHEDLEHL